VGGGWREGGREEGEGRKWLEGKREGEVAREKVDPRFFYRHRGKIHSSQSVVKGKNMYTMIHKGKDQASKGADSSTAALVRCEEEERPTRLRRFPADFPPAQVLPRSEKKKRQGRGREVGSGNGVEKRRGGGRLTSSESSEGQGGEENEGENRGRDEEVEGRSCSSERKDLEVSKRSSQVEINSW